MSMSKFGTGLNSSCKFGGLQNLLSPAIFSCSIPSMAIYTRLCSRIMPYLYHFLYIHHSCCQELIGWKTVLFLNCPMVWHVAKCKKIMWNIMYTKHDCTIYVGLIPLHYGTSWQQNNKLLKNLKWQKHLLQINF